jgi:acyl-CoA reductase-like NAD-dependent aldehyde dehydrogenase
MVSLASTIGTWGGTDMTDLLTDAAMIIGGDRRTTQETFGVINPSTGEIHAEAPECTREQLDEAMDAAAKAFVTWRVDEDARREALRQAAGVMFGAGAELGPILTREQGKPLAQASIESLGAGMWLNYFADLEVPKEVIQDDDTAYAEVVRKPVGVVAAITPWNFPLILASWKIGPALRAGNTMVLKPSPYTPLATLKMVELLQQVLPPGVLNVVSGGDDLGKWMTSHPVPRKISFTGSVATGKHVAASAAPDLKRVTLELGGNDAAIVLDDVDPVAVADKLFDGAFGNCGQICSAIKRVFVPEKMQDAIVERLAEKAKAIKVGDGFEDDVEMGPINNKPQYDRVKDLVSDAIAQGANVAAGGAPMDRPGYFFEPTILTGIAEGVRIVDEEQFGPAVPVLTYKSESEALDRANATMYGLSGSVWSSDLDRGAEVASKLECGTAWVNTHLAIAPNQPFGGFKWSGIGVEGGPWGLAAFTEIQLQYRAKG